nr:NADH dehydrogenase subunit 5 [Pseudocohnilembus persalinus]
MKNYIIKMFITASNSLKVFFFDKFFAYFKLNQNSYIFKVLISYLVYLISISFFINLDFFSFSVLDTKINIFYLPVLLNIFLFNIVYFYFFSLFTFIFDFFIIKVNFYSIFVTYGLSTVKFYSHIFNFISFDIFDFYQFYILKYFSSLYSFYFELTSNFLSYPIFILFAVLFLLTSFFSLLSMSYLGFYGVFVLNFISLFLLWLSVIPYIASIMKFNNFYYISLGKWMYLATNYKINFDFLIDNISLSFSFLTLTIAIFVYLYAFSYFRYEPLVDRLIIFLNLFIISMVFLVSSGNFVMLFLGWELIGLTSFFLINFWSTRVGTLKAAFKAYSFNKTSDLFLFFAILLIFNVTYNLDIASFIMQISYYKNYMVNFLFFDVNLIDLISLLFLGCAFIKSAQIGAHIWLPDSMEAPVPASSLIHSATLVSAGIFLLLRFSALFEISNIAFPLIAVVGSFTAFYGGLVSMYQSDTKKVLAYSTISHCGFLMVVYTTGVVEYVLLYLYVHGFFKAAIFMSVGNVNRYSRNNQDFKKMGSYYKFLPFDCLMCFIGLINLSGLPFTLGFYIKHLLFVGMSSYIWLYYFVLVNCLLGAFTGLFYSYRLFYNVFFDFKKGKKKLYSQASELNLKSKFYSNTALLGNLSIIGLLITSYIVSLYLLFIYGSKDFNFSNFSTFMSYTSFIDNFVASKNFLYTVSYLNWFVLFLIFAIIFTPWRKTIYLSKYLNSFFSIILFFFFTSIFLVVFNI